MCVNIKNNTQTHESMLTVSDDILTPIGIKPGPMDTSSGDSSLLQFKPFSNEKAPIFWPKTQININASFIYNHEKFHTSALERNANRAVLNNVSQSVAGQKSSLKPDSFNAFNTSSQFSVHNSTLNTSVISEVNNIGSTNIVDGNSFTPCHTQEPFNRELKILDFEVDEKKKPMWNQVSTQVLVVKLLRSLSQQIIWIIPLRTSVFFRKK